MEYCCYEYLQPPEPKAPREVSPPSFWHSYTKGYVGCPFHILGHKSYTFKYLVEDCQSEHSYFNDPCGLWEFVTMIEARSTHWGSIIWVCLSCCGASMFAFWKRKSCLSQNGGYYILTRWCQYIFEF